MQEKLASVVAVAAGGILDLVREGDNGYLYPPGGLGDLRERVGRLAAQPVLRQRMGVAARASVQDRGWDRFGDLLIQHYLPVRQLRGLTAA